jgi:hypothetical protein
MFHFTKFLRYPTLQFAVFTTYFLCSGISVYAQLSTLQPRGTISLSHQYGITPFSIIDSSISNILTLQGTQSIIIKNVPFALQGRYTSIRTIAGLNNYFRVSFDQPRYRQIKSQELLHQKTKWNDSILNIQKEQQNVHQRLNYLKYLQTLDSADYQNRLNTVYEKRKAEWLQQHPADSTQLPDRSELLSDYPQSANYRHAIAQLITVQESAIAESTSHIEHYKKQISATDSLLKQLQRPAWAPKQVHVQQFAMGMCFPEQNLFTLSGIPLRGIQTTLSTRGWYVQVAGGKSIINLNYTGDLIQDNLLLQRNIFNYFDFNQLTSGRLIAGISAGPGAESGTHLRVNISAGKGLQSYWQDSTTTLNAAMREVNVVVGISGAWVYKQHVLRASYAKSMIEEHFADVELVNTNGKLWDAAFRSHAVQVSYQGGISASKTSWLLRWRHVDPFFRSYGAAFIRPDHARYEAKVMQQITAKWSLEISARQDANNVLGLYSGNMLLRGFGIGTVIKPNSRLQVRANYQPVFQQVNYATEQLQDTSHQSGNHLYFASAFWRPKIKRGIVVTTLTISGFSIADENARSFRTLQYAANYTGKKGWRTTMNYQWFSIIPEDTLYSTNGMLLTELGYVFKNGLQTDAGYKVGHNAGGLQSGFVVRLFMPISKGLSAQAELQRLVQGDYYNMIQPALFKQFPYLAQVSIHYTR